MKGTRSKPLYLFLILNFSFVISVVAQPTIYTSKNSKAVKLYEEALKQYDARQNEKATELLLKALEKDAKFIEPYILLADIAVEQKNYEKAMEHYSKSFDINPDFFPNNYFRAAGVNLLMSKYAEAKKYYEKFLSYPRVNQDLAIDARRYVQSCDFAIEAMKHPVPFEPHNMGPAVNTDSFEYYPAITADDQVFLFTRNTRDGNGSPTQEDFYVSKRKGDVWVKANGIGPTINTTLNEGAPTLSADGQFLIFAACDRKNGMGSCDIFVSRKVGTIWGRPANIGPPVNSKYWESQPSFSSDGKTLYFVSNRPGGMGDADIWQSTMKSDGTWGMPENLGPKINTPEKEESPCIHPDTKTLYFASDGRVGMGRTDIFVIRKEDNGGWGEAMNLGYPINTSGEENSLLVSGAGNVAYFGSDREGGFGGLDIYSFDLYEGARPGKITYMKGKVYDSRTKKPLAASFELIDLETSKTVIESESNQGDGEFLVSLPVNKNYALNVSKPGYLFYSENFSMKEMKDISKPFFMDVPLQPIDTGLTVQLKNIFFETNKYDLKGESKVELQKLVSFLNNNKTMKIELGGHTDNTGDKKLNATLSHNRAKSVYEYLVTNGIGKERLSFKGYGDSKPIAPNDTPENKQKNRRTEFKVMAK